nr:MAG TPA: hypothetical protein [Caudoviricetes sp.]
MWYNNLNKSTRPLEEAQEGGYLKSPALPKSCVPRGVRCRQSGGFCFIRTSFVETLALQAET